MAKVVQLILTTLSRGASAPGDSVRDCEQLWTLDGTLLAERDPLTEKSWFLSRPAPPTSPGAQGIHLVSKPGAPTATEVGQKQAESLAADSETPQIS